MKKCKTCKLELPINQFNKHTGAKDGLSSYCKKCNSERSKRYHEANKEKRHAQHKAWRNRTKFGLTEEQFQEMLLDQGGKCAICGGRDKDRELAVDHCHSTGAVRGLLCGSCNNGLGRFKDDVELLKNAIKYLHKEDK